MTGLLRLLTWPLSRLRGVVRRREATWSHAFVADTPRSPRPEVLYLIGEDGVAWFAALSCPCGCADLIQLSLLEQDRPHWRATLDGNGVPTLYPSVWRRKGCRSHFFLSRGRVHWVPIGWYGDRA